MMASRIEWEKEWLDKVGAPAKPKEVKPVTPTQFKQQAEAKKLHNIGKGNTSLMNALKNL
jgi:hypothetical protein